MLSEADQTELMFAAMQKHRLVGTIEHAAKKAGRER
jgi:hypothetical protein